MWETVSGNNIVEMMIIIKHVFRIDVSVIAKHTMFVVVLHYYNASLCYQGANKAYVMQKHLQFIIHQCEYFPSDSAHIFNIS